MVVCVVLGVKRIRLVECLVNINVKCAWSGDVTFVSTHPHLNVIIANVFGN